MSSFRNPSPSSGLWSIERVVALLTPVFAAAAGVITSFASKLVPGVTFTKGEVTGLFISGATVAGGAALAWLHGRQKFVNFATDADRIIDGVGKQVQAVGGPSLMDIEQVLRAHETSIVQAVGDKIGASVSMEKLAATIVQEIIQGKAVNMASNMGMSAATSGVGSAPTAAAVPGAAIQGA